MATRKPRRNPFVTDIGQKLQQRNTDKANIQRAISARQNANSRAQVVGEDELNNPNAQGNSAAPVSDGQPNTPGSNESGQLLYLRDGGANPADTYQAPPSVDVPGGGSQFMTDAARNNVDLTTVEGQRRAAQSHMAATSGAIGDFTTGSSNTLAAWGLSPDDELTLLDNPTLFLRMMRENGMDTNTLSTDDLNALYAQQQLANLTGAQSMNGDPVDMVMGAIGEWQTPGGQYMSMADASNMIFNPSAAGAGAIEQAYRAAEDSEQGSGARLINSLMLNAISQTTPDFMLSSYSSMLSAAAEDYQVAVMNGTFHGTYMEYLQQSGYSEIF